MSLIKLRTLPKKIEQKTGEILVETKDSLVNAADRNSDGKVDTNDIIKIKNEAGDFLKEKQESAKIMLDETEKRLELNYLKPIFPDDIKDFDFKMSKFIRVAQRDKKHAESLVCQGSVGHYFVIKDQKNVNIYDDAIDDFGIKFYPNRDSEFYFIDPVDRNLYIALDDYFGYLKSVRINELERIAQDLGAKHFKVIFKEEQTSFVNKDSKGKLNAKNQGKVSMDEELKHKKFYTIDVEAEMRFPGHNPIKPKLKYLQNDPDILNLIDMHMDQNGSLLNQTLLLKLSQSTDMKDKDAINIDTAFKNLKYNVNYSVLSEVRKESNRYLEYIIEF